MRIGRYTVPNLRLYPMLVEAVKLLYNEFSLNDIDNLDTAAKVLGHVSAKSGAFLQKVATLRAYGLLEGRGKVRVTGLGRALAYPTSREEEAKAIEEAIKNIPLWRELYSRFGIELPKENFWATLAEVAGLDDDEAHDKEEWVRRAYLTDTRNLRRPSDAFQKPRAVEAYPPTAPSPPRPEGGAYIELIAGEIRLKLPLNLESLEIVEGALNILKKSLQSEEKWEET